MAQTRAISRACRSAFAHVVVMMNAGLSTTPAEEVPMEGFDGVHEAEFSDAPMQREQPAPQREARAVVTVTPEHEIMLEDKMREAGVDPAIFLKPSGVSCARDLPEAHFAKAMESLNRRIAAIQSKNPQRSEELADEIPY
jgi:hypothetical protein